MSRQIPFKFETLTVPINRFEPPLNKIRQCRVYNRFEYFYQESFFEFWTYYQFLNISTFFLSSFNTSQNILNYTSLYDSYKFFEPASFNEPNENDPEFVDIDEINSIDPKDLTKFLRDNNDEDFDTTFITIDTLIYTTLSLNNIFVNLTNIQGTSKLIKHCGLIGLKGPKKRTRIAIQETIEVACKKISGPIESDIFLFIRGFNKNRRTVFDTLSNLNKINIIQILDQTNKAHNGCKPKKKRRV